jgi:biopolymer transport protein ExbD
VSEETGVVRKTTINTDERLEFDMTPMIDCCFQLIIFFMLTLRYAQPEGDFNIKMPLGTTSVARPDDTALPPIRVRLRAAGDGKLAGIQLNERPIAGFGDLRSLVRSLSAGAGPGAGDKSPEVELDCDYNLKFSYTVQAITAVTGYLADDGQTIVKLVDKIKFAAPRQEGAQP